MYDRQVDGLIVAAMYTHAIALPKGLPTGPAVLLNALSKRPSSLPSVLPDEAEAGRAAARLLLDAGHRDGIHLIGAGPGVRDVPPGGVAALERLQGIRTTLAAAGVSVASGQLLRSWEPPDGLASTRALLRRTTPRALICLNDRLAVGAYQALGDAGLRVPTDVSVVFFDDDAVASWIRPGLTTIGIPHYDLGRTAVDVLFEEIARAPDPVEQQGTVHRVPMPVRERGSIAPPRR
jgi:LacI family transcriptional regulator